MTAIGWIKILVFLGVIAALTRPLGVYLFRVFEAPDDKRPLPRTFGRAERLLLRACGLRAPREQTWLEYTVAMLAFSALGVLVTYFIQRFQGSLPLDPEGLPDVD